MALKGIGSRLIEALTKRWQTEGKQEPPDIFNRHDFKCTRVADLDRPFEG
jgi:hypothetical protein